jgi:hypothetical protein
MPYTRLLVGRYGWWADGRDRVVRGLSCSHTRGPAVLAGWCSKKGTRGSSELRAPSIEANTTHRTRRGQELATHAGCSGSHQVCTPTHCSYSYSNSTQLGSYADRRPPLAP